MSQFSLTSTIPTRKHHKKKFELVTIWCWRICAMWKYLMVSLVQSDGDVGGGCPQVAVPLGHLTSASHLPDIFGIRKIWKIREMGTPPFFHSGEKSDKCNQCDFASSLQTIWRHISKQVPVPLGDLSLKGLFTNFFLYLILVGGVHKLKKFGF